MNDPEKNESAEATDETLKKDEQAPEGALDDQDVDGVAGGGFVCGGGFMAPPGPGPTG